VNAGLVVRIFGLFNDSVVTDLAPSACGNDEAIAKVTTKPSTRRTGRRMGRLPVVVAFILRKQLGDRREGERLTAGRG